MEARDPQGERKFLHDIATPVSVGLMCLESALENLKKTTEVDATVLRNIEKSVNALEKIRKLLQERREFLINSTSDS